MLGGWSSTIDPIQLADKGARLSGELPIKGMSRLVEMCRDDSGSVRIDLQFDRVPNDGARIMQGKISARISVTCQRCMGGMAHTLTSTPRMLLLRPGERDDLSDTDDVLVIDQPVTLGALIEDELLLEMPMVPMHAVEDCSVKPGIQGSREQGTEGRNKKEEKRPNPFAALATLKRRADKQN